MAAKKIQIEAWIILNIFLTLYCTVTVDSLTTPTPTVGVCHADILRAGSSCIRFYNRRMLSWQEARDECKATSGTLLRFASSADIAAFSVLAKTFQIDGWWADLTSQNHPGVWTWGDNQAVTNGSVVWNQEPDDIKHAENCVAVNFLGDAGDEMCLKTLGFICKAKAVADGCDGGWSMVGSSCYYVSDTSFPTELLSWQQARHHCVQMSTSTMTGSTLVSFQSKQEYTSVMKLLTTAYYQGYRWWTGLNDRAQEGQWRWADNSVADTSVIKWEHLPGPLENTEQCGVVHSNGHISYGHCSRDHYFACRYHNARSELVAEELGCGGSWLRAGQKCYVFNSNSSMTRDRAIAYCMHRGGHLLKVESVDEMRWVQLQTEEILANNFWTGLQRTARGSNSWQWQDGTSANMDLVHWNLEPNNVRGEENCAYINHDMQYLDISCFDSAAYICETQTEDAACPSGWLSRTTEDSTYCYYFSNTTVDARATWWEARELCRKLSGEDEASLLAINDQDEQTYMTTQIGLQPKSIVGWWTDLTDAKHEGVWIYGDSWNKPPKPGSINWASEPNNVGGKEDCTVMYYGAQYNDITCDSRAAVACEKMYGGSSSSAIKISEMLCIGCVVMILST